LYKSCTRDSKKLEEEGHELVLFTPPNVPRAIEMYYGLMSADGSKTIQKMAEFEDLEPTLNQLFKIATIPKWMKGISSFIVKLLGWTRIHKILKISGEKSVEDLWKLQYERKLYTDNFITQMQNAKIDAIICPALSLPAFPHGASKDLTPSVSYTMLYNLTNFPAGTVPVTIVQADDLIEKRNIKKDLWESKAAKVDENSEGLPIGVQVISFPFQDEMVLRVMREIEELFPFDQGKQLRTKIVKSAFV